MKEPPNRGEHLLQRAIVCGHTALQKRQMLADLGIRARNIAQPHERPDDEHAHLDGPRAVQNGRRHDRAVFGEGPRRHRGESEAREVVTICDHLRPFAPSHLEPKVLRKAPDVPPDRLIQRLRWDSVDLRKGCIENNLPATNDDDPSIDVRRGIEPSAFGPP